MSVIKKKDRKKIVIRTVPKTVLIDFFFLYSNYIVNLAPNSFLVLTIKIVHK